MVSFIIVNFNGEKYIERCIRSVLALKVEKEIIVVDNGSTDRSRDLINKFNVKKLFLKKNSGYPSGVNKGMLSVNWVVLMRTFSCTSQMLIFLRGSISMGLNACLNQM